MGFEPSISVVKLFHFLLELRVHGLVCVPSVYLEGWGGSRWLLGLIPIYTTCSGTKWLPQLNAACSLQIVPWVQSTDRYCDTSMSPKWVKIPSTIKNLPILHDRPMVHTRDREPVTQVGSEITSLQIYWAQTPLMFIHWCGCPRPADET